MAPADPPSGVIVPAPVPEHGTGPVPTPGVLVPLAPNLHRLTAPNPGLMTGPGTNTYLAGGSASLAVVDPGPDDPGHTAALVAAAERLGGRVRWIVVTHTHLDHAPGAALLAQRTGAEVIGYSAGPAFSPDRTVGEGWCLDGSDFSLRAVHTPGHASDHLCWWLEGTDVLCTGDHVMHGSTVVIRPPDGDMAVYLASLQKVARLLGPLTRLAPGHGRLIEQPAAVLAALRAHRLGREERVASALATAGRATVDELLGLVYADVTEAQLPVARFSLWAHLRKLADEGRAVPVPSAGDDGSDPEGELSATWHATAATGA